MEETNITQEKLWTPKEIAKKMKVTPYTVRLWIREGKLHGEKLTRKMIIVSDTDFKKFLTNFQEEKTNVD